MTTHIGFVVNVEAKDVKTVMAQVGNLKND